MKPNDVKTRIQGDLHIQYFRCQDCGEPYIILVTGVKLRKMIARGLGRSKAAKEYIRTMNLKNKVNIETLREH